MGARPERSGKKSYLTTFTYYIPSPPQRKSGYREVEFDKIMRGILASGYSLESLQTQSTDSGLFILATLSTKDKKVFLKDERQDMHEAFKLSHTHSSPDIILDEEEDV